MLEEVVRVTVTVEQLGIDDSRVERLRSSTTIVRTMCTDLVSRRAMLASDLVSRAAKWLESLGKAAPR